MPKRTFWSNTAISLIPYLRLDRERASEFEKATAAASVILTSTQKPQRVDEFCSGIGLIQGESWEGAVERVSMGFKKIEKNAVKDYSRMLFGGMSALAQGGVDVQGRNSKE